MLILWVLVVLPVGPSSWTMVNSTFARALMPSARMSFWLLVVVAAAAADHEDFEGLRVLGTGEAGEGEEQDAG